MILSRSKEELEQRNEQQAVEEVTKPDVWDSSKPITSLPNLLQQLFEKVADLERRVKRLELFAGDVSRDAWSRAKRDADSGGESKAVVGPNLPRLPVKTELNNIGGATI